MQDGFFCVLFACQVLAIRIDGIKIKEIPVNFNASVGSCAHTILLVVNWLYIV
jgi:hypothetical protein